MHGATIDYEARACPEPEKDLVSIQFIRPDTSTPSPVLELTASMISPTKAKDYSRIKKGDVELMQLVNAGFATASLIDKVLFVKVQLALLVAEEWGFRNIYQFIILY